MTDDLEDLSKEQLRQRLGKLKAKLNEKQSDEYPWGKPRNDLISHIQILKTYFHDDYGEALSKTDSKTLAFFTEYLDQELSQTYYTEWTPTRKELDNLKDSVRKLLMKAEPDILDSEENQMLEDWINEEGQFSHDRNQRIESGANQ